MAWRADQPRIAAAASFQTATRPSGPKAITAYGATPSRLWAALSPGEPASAGSALGVGGTLRAETLGNVSLVFIRIPEEIRLPTMISHRARICQIRPDRK